MDHVYMDDEALDASELSCLVTPPIGNSDVSILDLSESLALSPKATFLDKVMTMLGKKPSYKKGSKTLLQQIQSAQSEDNNPELSSTYRKTTRIWAFKIIPLKKGSK